jgi:death-on-curing protein
VKYLTTRDLLAITEAALGPNTPIRDAGLIDSAAQRPRTTAFGEDAYPGLHAKAAAILHSILRNHPLVDGNKRLAWVACRTFLAVNGADFTPDEDAAVDFVMRAAASELEDVAAIAAVLREWTG